ncbi:MAG TPA: STAS domain-containing protein [Pontiella sp.]
MATTGNNDNLTAAYIKNTAIIRVEGRGSFKISPSIKQFVHQVINTHSAERIIIDMSKCTGMDSTFMGITAGVACLIKRTPETSFKLINLSENNEKLLKTLGVDRVVDYSLSASDEEQQIIDQGEDEKLDPDSTDKLDTAQTTLTAHETLVDINPENLSKFKSVLEFLQEDVRNLSQE